MWPASMQIYWNKRKRLHKKSVQLPEDWFGTPTWPPFHCFQTPIWPPWRHVKTLYNFARAPRFFVHFLAFVARLPQDTSNFKSPLYMEWVKTQKFSSSVSKLRYGPFGFNPSNFADIWQIKWIWIRWMMMTFELVRIHFLSGVLNSVCCDPEMLLAWWRDGGRFLSIANIFIAKY